MTRAESSVDRMRRSPTEDHPLGGIAAAWPTEAAKPVVLERRDLEVSVPRGANAACCYPAPTPRAAVVLTIQSRRPSRAPRRRARVPEPQPLLRRRRAHAVRAARGT